jgi:hypothetical protein
MTSTQTPAQWLITEYEAVNPADILQPDDPDDENPDNGTWPPGRSVTIQPLFALKSDMDSGYPMRVTRDDYRDPGRWWL